MKKSLEKKTKRKKEPERWLVTITQGDEISEMHTADDLNDLHDKMESALDRGWRVSIAKLKENPSEEEKPSKKKQ